jgi:hypothetical protein
VLYILLCRYVLLFLSFYCHLVTVMCSVDMGLVFFFFSRTDFSVDASVYCSRGVVYISLLLFFCFLMEWNGI